MFPGARVIGKSVRHPIEVAEDDRTAQNLWESMERDGSLAFLLSLPTLATPPGDTVGWQGDWQPGEDAYTYLVGVLVQPGSPVPEGFELRDIAAGELAIGWIQETAGEEGGDMVANASAHVNAAREALGYEFDSSRMAEMEYYSKERFRDALARGEPPILDMLSPCKKA